MSQNNFKENKLFKLKVNVVDNLKEGHNIDLKKKLMAILKRN